MPLRRRRRWRPGWLHLPRRTARFRLTALYGSLFLLSGAALVAVTFGLFERATRYRAPQLPHVPHTPALRDLERLVFFAPQTPKLTFGTSPRASGITLLTQVHTQLTQVDRQLKLSTHPLTSVRDKLARAQHQLSQAQEQLVKAVHQLTRTGVAQAAQRAADSHQLLVDSGIALAIVAVLALLAGGIVAGRILRPIRTITRTANRISSTSLHERLALVGPEDELKDLGDTLDDLFARLEAAFDAQRHFVANASHELRTPLTADRNLLQVALDDPCTSAASWRATARELLASNDEQEDLIEALLALASSESCLDHRERTDLGHVCRTVLERRVLDTGRLGLSVEASIRAAPVDCDPRLVERLVTNLLDNAIGHNVPGGEVEVLTGVLGDAAFLSVTNTGPVIAAADVDRLFQPFQRLDPRRTHHVGGHGLGLSIVRAIAATHRATICAEALPDGGLSLTVAFPPPADAGLDTDLGSRTPSLAQSHA
jgi:signal transduction histidine kinase